MNLSFNAIARGMAGRRDLVMPSSKTSYYAFKVVAGTGSNTAESKQNS
jgi:hypothetical protein